MSIFNSVKAFHPRRNTFNLSHERKFSCPMAKMVPILCEEVIPGDRWQVSTEMMLRLAPMISPVMHRVNVYTHFFYVPYRLVWENWKNFITGGERPTTDNPDVYGLWNGHIPSFSNNGSFTGTPDNTFTDAERATLFGPGSLCDYMGINPVVDYTTNNWNQFQDSNSSYSILPFRAYQMIYNEYYRDEVLQDPIVWDTSDKAASDKNNLMSLLTMRTRNWEKDYYTTATPWTQKGNPVNVISQVTVPSQGIQGTTTPATGPHQHDIITQSNFKGTFKTKNGSSFNNTGQSVTLMPAGNHSEFTLNQNADSNRELYYDPNGFLKANTGGAAHSHSLADAYTDSVGATGSVSVNDIRAAFQVQRWLERNMRAGSRYIESMLAHFGVRSSDARLQRPEFLGGGKSPVVISEVLQTANTASGDTGGGRPTGDMAGHGYSAAGNHAFRRFFEEHGVVMGIMTVMPRSAYNTPNRRHFFHGVKTPSNTASKPYTGSRFDFFWPEFAHLGEQSLYMQELSPGSTDPYYSFGYTPRYNEYRFIPSSVHGMFKSTMKHWHMARENQQGSLWLLNSAFITADPTRRIFAITNGPDADQQCWVQLLHKIKAIRPIPKFGAGGLVDH